MTNKKNEKTTVLTPSMLKDALRALKAANSSMKHSTAPTQCYPHWWKGAEMTPKKRKKKKSDKKYLKWYKDFIKLLKDSRWF